MAFRPRTRFELAHFKQRLRNLDIDIDTMPTNQGQPISYQELDNYVRILWIEATITWTKQSAVAARALEIMKNSVSVLVPPEADIKPDKTGKVDFRIALLTKCQREFEIDTGHLETKLLSSMEARREMLLFAGKGCGLEKCHTETPFDDDINKLMAAQQLYIRNVRFVGELYKVGVLTKKIIAGNLRKLLRDANRLSLSALCALLQVVGPSMDEDPGAMDHYFIQMEKLTTSESVDDDTKDLLKYYISWRKNKWVIPDVNPDPSD